MFLNLGLGGRFLGNEWRPCLYCWIWSIRFVLITYSNLTGGKYHCVYFNKYLELRRLTFMDLPKLLAFLLNSVENRALIWCLKKKKYYLGKTQVYRSLHLAFNSKIIRMSDYFCQVKNNLGCLIVIWKNQVYLRHAVLTFLSLYSSWESVWCVPLFVFYQRLIISLSKLLGSESV